MEVDERLQRPRTGFESAKVQPYHSVDQKQKEPVKPQGNYEGHHKYSHGRAVFFSHTRSIHHVETPKRQILNRASYQASHIAEDQEEMIGYYRKDKVLCFGIKFDCIPNIFVDRDRLVENNFSRLIVVLVKIRIPRGLHRDDTKELKKFKRDETEYLRLPQAYDR